MATRHLSIQDSTTHLPQSNGDVDYEQVFTAPELNLDTRPFLSYRVTPSGPPVTLQIDLNGTQIVSETFQTTQSRVLNEIFDLNILLAQGNNTLVVRRQAGPGSFAISDLIMMYPADS